MYKIYKITNKINNRFYIGKTTKSLQTRFYWHVKASKKKDVTNSAIHSAMKMYGEDNFTIEEIDGADTLDELNEKERYWISFYRKNNLKLMYNIADGGEGGATCNDYVWYTDGTHDYYFSKYEEIPNHLTKGRSQVHVDNTNTIWINNGKIQKHIKKDDLNKYSEWSLGMLERSDEWKEKSRKAITSEKARENSKIALQKFHAENPHWTNQTSFKKGNAPINKGKISITNGKNNRFIYRDELNTWIKDGWHKGFTMNKHRAKNK